MTRAEQLEAAADAWRDALGKAKAAEGRTVAAQGALSAAEMPFWERMPTDEERAAIVPLRAAQEEAERAHAGACRDLGLALDALLQIAAAPSS